MHITHALAPDQGPSSARPASKTASVIQNISFESVEQSLMSEELAKLKLPADIRRILTDVDRKETKNVIAEFRQVLEDRRNLKSELIEERNELTEQLAMIRARLANVTDPEDHKELKGLATLLQRRINMLNSQIRKLEEEISALSSVLDALAAQKDDPFRAFVELAEARVMSLDTQDQTDGLGMRLT